MKRQIIITLSLNSIIILFLIGCADNKEHKMETEIKSEFMSQPEKVDLNNSKSDTVPCNSSALDILKLKDPKIQSDFFHQIDSIRKVQYPNNNQDKYNSLDITPRLLSKFLQEINTDTLKNKAFYVRNYFFNSAPPEYIDSEKCKDKISIQYFSETCGFRMEIVNVYLVDKRDCIGGSTVIYGFKIVEGKIINFGIQEAG